jgi:hypothetical protein
VVGDRVLVDRSYISLLERGLRDFSKRGLIEDLANALSCSVTDLTGQPYSAETPDTIEALATLPPISAALADATLDDVPDISARPVADLARLARSANSASADAKYSIAGRDLATLLLELHVHAVTGDGDTRRAALAALVEACIVATGSARNFGNFDLARIASERAIEAAARLEDPMLGGFAAMSFSIVLGRMGSKYRAPRVASEALGALAGANPDAEDTSKAEAAGMLHLASAQLAAKSHNSDLAATHLAEAASLAARTGERRALCYDFGPSNVEAWAMAVAVEEGKGPEQAEKIIKRPGFEAGLISNERLGALYFDISRGLGQGNGRRDLEAIRYLDMADRVAPQRIRQDPLARSLADALDKRAERKYWELKSLRNRICRG